MTDQPPSDLSQNVDQIDQIIDQAASREENAFLSFMRIYLLSNPKPNYEAFAKWGTISILCLMLTAASATGIAFAVSAQTELVKFFPDAPRGFLTFIAVLIAFVSVLGVEGYVVATGMQSGIGKEMKDVGRTRAIAAFLLLFVSVVAGLYQRSFKGNLYSPALLDYLLTYTYAIAVPLAIYLASPYLGLLRTMQAAVNTRWLSDCRNAFKGSDVGTNQAEGD